MNLKLNVIFAVPKLLPLSRYKITEGNKFRLLCSIENGSPPLFFQWSKNGQILSRKSQVNYRIESADEHSTLTIANVHRSDAANYTCNVNNAFGSDSQTAVLDVRGTRVVL